MRRHLQLIEQALIVKGIGSEAMQIDRALRGEVNLAGVAGQIILRLRIAVAAGIDRFAAVAEFAQRLADILQRRLIGAGKVAQIEHDAGNFAVAFRLPDSRHDIEQRVFLQPVAAGAQQLTANFAQFVADRRLIHHHAGKIDLQRAARHFHRRAGVFHL